MSAFFVSKDDIDLLASAIRQFQAPVRMGDQFATPDAADPRDLGQMLWSGERQEPSRALCEHAGWAQSDAHIAIASLRAPGSSGSSQATTMPPGGSPSLKT